MPAALHALRKRMPFDIHQMHFFQIQSYAGCSMFDLGLDPINVLRSKLPAQPNPRVALTRNPFDPHILELTNVARPAIRLEQVERFSINCSELLSSLFSEAINEVLNKQGNVGCAIA
jgi:hypothetical protein